MIFIFFFFSFYVIRSAGLIDADSIESLPAQLHHRASLTNTRFLSGTSPSSSNVPARLSRSNSIRWVIYFSKLYSFNIFTSFRTLTKYVVNLKYAKTIEILFSYLRERTFPRYIFKIAKCLSDTLHIIVLACYRCFMFLVYKYFDIIFRCCSACVFFYRWYLF